MGFLCRNPYLFSCNNKRRIVMNTLQELYVDQLQDLWSANQQAAAIAEKLRSAASESRLQDVLGRSITRITEHNKRLEAMIREVGQSPSAEHCKGMEGLVQEARKHALEFDYTVDAVRDAQIIAQFQRISHYGLAVYGTCAALAKELGRNEEAAQLANDLSEVRKGDDIMSEIAEYQVNQKAAA
jgi:ferritin-like metal-binding protein YciE